jgi:hypothetical protein
MFSSSRWSRAQAPLECFPITRAGEAFAARKSGNDIRVSFPRGVQKEKNGDQGAAIRYSGKSSSESMIFGFGRVVAAANARSRACTVRDPMGFRASSDMLRRHVRCSVCGRPGAMCGWQVFPM